MSSETKPIDIPAPPPRKPPPSKQRGRAALAAALVVAGLSGAGVTALAQRSRHDVLVALTPGPVSALTNGNAAAVTGQVAEIFGNKFILADDSGRALIETGPRGEGGGLVTKSETVTVQGRFADGVMHAVAIRHGDGRTVVLGPPAPPAPPRPPLG